MQKEMGQMGSLNMHAPLGSLDKLTSPHLVEQGTLKTSQRYPSFLRAELPRHLETSPGMSG